MKRRIPSVALAGVLLATAPHLAYADPAADPKHDCLAASDLGQNERDEGKYRAARKAFIVCARDVCPAVVVQTCSKWLAELDATAPTIVFEVKDEQGNDLSDVSVTLDGGPFAARIDGRPLEVDAGSHVLRFERTGSEPVEQEVIFRTGERARLVSVTLKSASPPAQPSSEAEAVVERASPSLITPRFVTAASLGVAAVASGAIGAYFLVQSNQRADEASQLRNTLGASDACTNVSSMMCSTLNDKVQAQHGDAAAAIGLFVGAGAFAVGAVAAWFLWPTSPVQPAQSSFWLVPSATQTGLALHAGAAF